MRMESVNPAAVPQRRLSNGMVIPGIGMGTFGNDRYTPEEVADAVYGAIKAGYRLLDCAAAYGNERDIGRVLSRTFEEGIVRRQELTVMTKLWNDMHGQGDVLVACAKSLRDLGLDYVDVYMVHWPFPNYHAPGARLKGRNPDAVPFSAEEYLSVWRQMEHLVDMGIVRSLGMSNMTITKLEQVLPLCRIKPVVLEVEINPTFQQPKLFEYCIRHDILPVAFSPMGSPCRPERDTEEGDVVTFEMEELQEIARAHHCHPAEICVKWAVQRGHVPIPFSVYPEEYTGNLRCTTEDFLTDAEMEMLQKADRNARLIKGKVFLWEGAESWRDIWDGEDESNKL
ncbi:aldo/keto reductase [Extibacter muris]|uniref:Aldo/keto reductase n=2 Tax=Extibacter muris TaxID=1796622 RepID=A0A4R4FCS9_9FIRM|nr:aldo/keto reductase [Extibacter muris]MCU0080344.1 aldo/keto reductase [Extibacter muris]TDA20416.1 aldo/keto reductase [Extibacter muris]